ncbi:hypothetical protein B0H19DRAFT_1190947 [Mycena capillaripes]|nr:hypothetical protein B0H19DRAFT_1190947 [Mycena capillaripes]
MPLEKSEAKGQEPAESSSRLTRTLKRANTPKLPTQSGSSKGKTKASDEHRRYPPARVDNAENAPKPSSSRTRTRAEIHAPESRREKLGPSPPLTEALLKAFSSTSTANAPISDIGASSMPKPSESTFLAQKIRGLIDALPALSSRFLPSSKDPPIVDSDGRPIPPPGAVRIQDPELISLLSNSDVMNGSDGRRQSVWSMLEAIKPPSLQNAESVDGDYDYAGSDRSSVMMCSPLIPTLGSVVELADLEEVPIVPSASTSARWFTSWPDLWNLWPFNGWKATAVAEEHNITSLPISTTISATDAGPQTDPAEQRKVVPVRRVWVPSTTQLSFETTWWGYRIYLPPPVLAILDDQSVVAAQQTTMITAALTWFFTNLPVSAFPPPLQPAMILLQRLVPLVSYLGTFISWSWGTIRGFDRGHGVILTATWLLPIALIPSTWHARDVPPSSPAPESAEMPPEAGAPPDSPSVEPGPSVVHPAPAPITEPLPRSPDEPPAPSPLLKQQKSSTSGKSSGKLKNKTLRKLTRTFT